MTVVWCLVAKYSPPSIYVCTPTRRQVEKERAAASAAAAASSADGAASAAATGTAAPAEADHPLLDACKRGKVGPVRRLLGLPALPQAVEEAKFNFDKPAQGW